jgi:hypothetical protein
MRCSGCSNWNSLACCSRFGQAGQPKCAPAGQRLGRAQSLGARQRVNRFNEREAMEVSVAGIDIDDEHYSSSFIAS